MPNPGRAQVSHKFTSSFLGEFGFGPVYWGFIYDGGLRTGLAPHHLAVKYLDLYSDDIQGPQVAAGQCGVSRDAETPHLPQWWPFSSKGELLRVSREVLLLILVCGKNDELPSTATEPIEISTIVPSVPAVKGSYRRASCLRCSFVML
ncbi:uncharacterized protein [Aegilops tauschii subsp. strangulata]|uniref:uncharacterized protein n=1 Tax=Aegilops tauschii subsp. strangulata TaxID=200361 RepID=UPI001ABD18BE